MQKKCRQKITSTTRSLCGNSKLNGSHLPPHLCNVMTMGTLSHCAHHCMHACTHARTYPPSLTAHTHTHVLCHSKGQCRFIIFLPLPYPKISLSSNCTKKKGKHINMCKNTAGERVWVTLKNRLLCENKQSENTRHELHIIPIYCVIWKDTATCLSHSSQHKIFPDKQTLPTFTHKHMETYTHK